MLSAQRNILILNVKESKLKKILAVLRTKYTLACDCNKVLKFLCANNRTLFTFKKIALQ